MGGVQSVAKWRDRGKKGREREERERCQSEIRKSVADDQ
jgi:hypothetical protein